MLPMTPPIEPPGTPPGTPPTTPAEAMTGGGASSSLIISTFLGILVGVRSSPFTMSVCTTLTTFTTAAAGGGGGGGGGGATRRNMVVPLGKASVKISGTSTMTPMIMNSIPNETNDVQPRFVFSLPPDSIRLSSNIVILPYFRPYANLDTDCVPFAPSFLARRFEPPKPERRSHPLPLNPT